MVLIPLVASFQKVKWIYLVSLSQPASFTSNMAPHTRRKFHPSAGLLGLTQRILQSVNQELNVGLEE